jgi:phospholipase/carboxylesterase
VDGVVGELESIRAGPLEVLASAARPAQGIAIVLCHGYGMAGNHLALVARRSGIGDRARWFFPQGAIVPAGEPGRRAWYQRPSDIGRDETVPAGFDGAVGDLLLCLEALTRDHELAPQRTFIGGFSQGAVVAIEAALRHDARFAGLVVLAGRLLAAHRVPPTRSWAGLPVLLSHAKNDEAIPLANAAVLRQVLEGHGARVVFHEHDGGHAVTKEVALALGAFVCG